jgi:hypothetical protein
MCEVTAHRDLLIPINREYLIQSRQVGDMLCSYFCPPCYVLLIKSFPPGCLIDQESQKTHQKF